MRRLALVIVIAMLSVSNASAMGGDDPVVTTLAFDELEYTAGDGGSGGAWRIEGRVGRDLNQLRLLTEGDYRDGSGEGQVRLVYSRAVSSFWNVAGGWRREFGDGLQWDAATLELFGKIPYNIETNVSLSVGEGDQALAWGRFEYTINFNRRLPRWVLKPELEFEIYSKEDAQRGVGSGLSETEFGLRLYRQFKPDLSPYVGLNWLQQFGDTASFSRAMGRDTSELRWVVGLQFWF
jgi:copper resistance protein B